MADWLLSRLPRRPEPGPRSRRIAGTLGMIAVGALAIGAIVGADLAGSSQGASKPAKSSGATTVQRRDLVATDTVAGTLGYANPQTVFNRMSGTITSLPTVGSVVQPGQTLYKVDGKPVVLLGGIVPAYRTLSQAVSDGLDVQQLKQNLVALGFDPNHQITINQTFDAATTAAVDNWQSSLGETQTGTVTLGQIVFLPAAQRITAVDTVLGSTGGGAASSAAGSGTSGTGSSSGSSGSSSSGSTSGSSTGASTIPAPPRAEFVSLRTASVASASRCNGSGTGTTMPGSSGATPDPNTARCPQSTRSSKPKPASRPTTLAALLALLRAETLELQKSRSSSSSGASAGRTAGATSSPATSRGATTGGTGGGAASASGGGATTSGSGAAAGAQAILQTTSTQRIVTVSLDATKQSEAVVGEPVTVQLPSGDSVAGKITKVSPVAQSASSSSSGAAGGSGTSSTPSATVPVTITLASRRLGTGLDQAAVSVNFQQQKASGVLSVPVTALVATAGGGYSVQESAPPHRLIPVTPGLFAAGYVQISGGEIYPGLQVTDSQG